MKIVRAPLRITLGGGGTDLPGWHQQHGGFLITAAIDKYIYLTGSRRIHDEKIWLSYSDVEVRDAVSEIEHQHFAKCLEEFEIPLGFELHSIAELPGNTGLGSSGAFLVAVIKLLSEIEPRAMSTQDIAELACRIEMIDLGRSSGNQDPYASAFGGITTLDIDREGNVTAAPFKLPPRTKKQLNNCLKLYSTGTVRESEDVLKDQNLDMGGAKQSAADAMTRIQEIGYESRDLLVAGDTDGFGRLLDDHWQTKKSISGKMSAPAIDALYDFAMQNGALGGKVVGAGGVRRPRLFGS
ncbi:MAG: galactokinase [Rhodospirillaceae bacterium]|nr:galactokinase [Rhodospirillaceae bacterium]